MTILVSYSEIALKSRYVRNQLEKSLSQDIVNILRKHGYPNPEVSRKFGRIYVEGVPEEAVGIVSKIFGVANAMPSTEAELEFNAIVNGIVEEAKISLKQGSSFAVRPRVVGEHPFGSRDIAYEAGSRVLDALADRGIHVNLDEPDVTLYAEVRDTGAYVYSRIIRGVLGLPYGTQGKAISLFSGGIDSPVGAWMLMKRGVAVLPLFMDQRPFVGDSYVERAVESFKNLSQFVPRTSYRLYSAPMGDVMQRITETREPRYICIMCKRSMYRIAERFAEKHHAHAIITGESLGQVASQTLKNLFVLSSSIDMPVLRPLVGLDKVEIEDIARIFGSYEITAKSTDGCTAVPKGPATRSDVETLEELEAELGLVELCYEAADNISVIAEG
ncbi:MAG: tRNA 4-thiouridine(8) synthase ThiI [Candidatus Bathyarchaeota archaeon]|nr:tRNA 4-thiouridine(8) synthase ThiI [Candidatus Bathyarchaeota archaeon]